MQYYTDDIKKDNIKGARDVSRWRVSCCILNVFK